MAKHTIFALLDDDEVRQIVVNGEGGEELARFGPQVSLTHIVENVPVPAGTEIWVQPQTATGTHNRHSLRAVARGKPVAASLHGPAVRPIASPLADPPPWTTPPPPAPLHPPVPSTTTLVVPQSTDPDKYLGMIATEREVHRTTIERMEAQHAAQLRRVMDDAATDRTALEARFEARLASLTTAADDRLERARKVASEAAAEDAARFARARDEADNRYTRLQAELSAEVDRVRQRLNAELAAERAESAARLARAEDRIRKLSDELATSESAAVAALTARLNEQRRIAEEAQIQLGQLRGEMEQLRRGSDANRVEAIIAATRDLPSEQRTEALQLYAAERGVSYTPPSPSLMDQAAPLLNLAMAAVQAQREGGTGGATRRAQARARARGGAPPASPPTPQPEPETVTVDASAQQVPPVAERFKTSPV